MEIKLKIETRLITWNEVAQMTWSKQQNKYANAKKKQQMFIKHEIRQQLGDDNIENIFGDNKTLVSYEWHSSTNYDLGNLTAGEKFIADSINDLGLWSDDRYTKEIRHKWVDDEDNYVLVTIKGAKNRGKA